MNKAEMEAHATEYQSLVFQARAAEKRGRFADVIRFALASCEHIDGMMQYDRKYQGKTFASVLGIDLVLRYAPLLFDHRSLDEIGTFLKDARRIERDTSADMGENLARARRTMWNAHMLWNYLEANPGARQDGIPKALGGDQDAWRSIAEAWEKMEVLHRAPAEAGYRVTLRTRMDEPLEGKCPSCGHIARESKRRLLEPLSCTHCHAETTLVLLVGVGQARRE